MHSPSNPPFRVGLGTDLHRLTDGRPCRLGGIDIPSPVGMDAVSDGDAVLHAVCDAVLGGAGCADHNPVKFRPSETM